jgi:transcriptional antiterminator RfaH
MSTTTPRPEPRSLPCYAVRVRSRGEQFVADLLRHKDFQVLVPTFTELRRYSDRVSRVTSALFPGYVFVRVGSQDLMRLLSTDGVSYVLRNGEAGGSLSDQETLAVEALCKGSEPRGPHSYLRVGRRVRIESGPFAGVEGVLAKVRDATRVVITVDALCSSVSVEIEPERVHLLDKAAMATLDTHIDARALTNA